MDTLPYKGLEGPSSDRDQHLVRVGELAGPESIEGIVELNVPRAATGRPLSRAGSDRRGRVQDTRIGFDEILRCAEVTEPEHARAMTTSSRIPPQI